MRYLLLGPEGFSTHPEGYETLDELAKASAQFILRFMPRGYYLTADHERIPLEDLPLMLSVEIVEDDETEEEEE